MITILIVDSTGSINESMCMIVDPSKHGDDHDIARLLTLPFVPTWLLTSIWQLKSGQPTKAGPWCWNVWTSSSTPKTGQRRVVWRQNHVKSCFRWLGLSVFLYLSQLRTQIKIFKMTSCKSCTLVNLLHFLKTPVSLQCVQHCVTKTIVIVLEF